MNPINPAALKALREAPPRPGKSEITQALKDAFTTEGQAKLTDHAARVNALLDAAPAILAHLEQQDTEDPAEVTAKVLDAQDQLVEATTGYRNRLTATGFTNEIAEVMTAQWHGTMLLGSLNQHRPPG